MVFAVFAIHVLSAAWGTSSSCVYAVCKKSAAIDGGHCDVLPSLGANADPYKTDRLAMRLLAPEVDGAQPF